jgi:hypothetical protein
VDEDLKPVRKTGSTRLLWRDGTTNWQVPGFPRGPLCTPWFKVFDAT